jgi:hypothetical protein
VNVKGTKWAYGTSKAAEAARTQRNAKFTLASQSESGLVASGLITNLEQEAPNLRGSSPSVASPSGKVVHDSPLRYRVRRLGAA